MLGSLASNLLSASRAFRLLGIVMVAPAAGSLIFAYPLAKAAAQNNQWGYVGLLVVPAALQVLLAVPIVRQLGWLREIGASFRVRPQRDDFLHYVRFHATTLLATFIGFVTFLVLPPLLIVNYGADANGFFRAAWSIGMQNLAIMLSSFGAYIVPVLSGARTEGERGKILNDAAFVTVLISVPLIGGLIVFQPLVIRILYNEQFLPSIEMLHWLLVANYFRVAQWLFLLVSTTRAHLKNFHRHRRGIQLRLPRHRLACRRFPAGCGTDPVALGYQRAGLRVFRILCRRHDRHGRSDVAAVSLFHRTPHDAGLACRSRRRGAVRCRDLGRPFDELATGGGTQLAVLRHTGAVVRCPAPCPAQGTDRFVPVQENWSRRAELGQAGRPRRSPR